MKKKIAILGSTGSIGTQALEVIDKLNSDFEIIALSAGSNVNLIAKQAEKYKPQIISISTKFDAEILQKRFPQIKILYGEEGLLEICQNKDIELILVAVSGKAGLKPTIEAIRNRKDIALANKETLVMAGEIVMKLAKEYNVKILPVDSEHSAIFQCLSDRKDVNHIIITSSGGPFRTATREEIENADLKSIRERLDKSHYGLLDVKNRIIEYLAVRTISDKVKSPIICLVGPPGVGKTTLAKSIADSLNRKFAKISVGGMSDEAEIRGHRRTYVGAYPGRIITSLKNAHSSNPVILIDEVDKMEKGTQGDPASALLEVLDRSQNANFRDNYLDIDYDISDVMFILTANDLEAIPYVLQDRLEIIRLSEYTEYEKCDIAKKYILPRLCEEHNLESIIYEDTLITNIIRNYTKEAGVRELERCLTAVLRKIITNMVMTNDYHTQITLDNNDIDKYLGRMKFKPVASKYEQVGVVSALSYTPYGGEIMPIEVNYYAGNGNLTLTGSLGNIMKESATIALSYIKSTASYFGIHFSDLVNNDIHIHLPAASISKDGPSAGVTLATSIISAFKGIKFASDVAMTGEITLRGHVLAVGGIKEKCIGAIKNNIKKIIVPLDNKDDVEALPSEIKDKVDFVFVDDYKQIYDYLMITSR